MDLLAASLAQAPAGSLIPAASDPATDQFRPAPQALGRLDDDTRTIEATPRELARTDAELAIDFFRAVKPAGPRYRTAISAGLAQTPIACSTVEQKAALLIRLAAVT